MNTALLHASSALVVCAHPDDESFGLGGVLCTLADTGSRLSVVCFTHGEASTLHRVAGDLAVIRAAELDAAGAILGVTHLECLDYPDGDLTARPLDNLPTMSAGSPTPSLLDELLVFDDGGITGHPDHQHATDAARLAAASLGITVVAWAIPAKVADALNDEFGTAFLGRSDDQLDVAITVDRARQLAAIARHRSQSARQPGAVAAARPTRLLPASPHIGSWDMVSG